MKLDKELERFQKRLKDEGLKVVQFFSELTEAQLRQQVYTTGTKWQVRQVLAHFVSAEEAFNKLIADVLQGGRGAPEDLNLDEFNEREVAGLSEKPLQELIDAFRKLREQTLSQIETMSNLDLAREGFHPWFGMSDLSKMIKLVYRHNMIHMRDIRRILIDTSPSSRVSEA
jgi:hypothetical protein